MALYCLKQKYMKKYYTQSQLLQQGWKIKLINKYLGNPDYRVPNPSNINWVTIKQYDADRVYIAAQNPEVSKVLRKPIRR
jgi:hypothetical protein